jgi:hypothetical protein
MMTMIFSLFTESKRNITIKKSQLIQEMRGIKEEKLQEMERMKPNQDNGTATATTHIFRNDSN